MTYKALLDTNILLDAVMSERPQHAEASEVVALAVSGQALFHVSATSLKDFFYLARKTVSVAEARRWIAFFLDVCEVVPVDRASCVRALGSDNPDFEDALVEAAVAEVGADVLVSRDAEGFAGLTVPRLSAAELVDLVRKGRGGGR